PRGPPTGLRPLGLSLATPAARAAVRRALAARLAGHDELLGVRNGATADERPLQAFLWRHRYLLSPAVDGERFTAPALTRSLEGQLQRLSSPLGPLVEELLPSDPSGELLVLLDLWRSQGAPERRYGVWFSRGGQLALLVAEIRGSPFDADRQRRVLAAIEAALAGAKAQVANVEPRALEVELTLSGPLVIAAHTRDTIRREAQFWSAIACGAVILLLWGLFRSLPIVALSTIPMASAVAAGAAATGLVFGQLYGLTLAFGVTLLGIAIDYPLHLFAHRRPGETGARCMARIWPTLRLGALTTALGYSAMLDTRFEGLAQLGVFAIAGLAAATAANRWVLPALLDISPVHNNGRLLALGGWSAPLPPPKVRWILLGTALLGLLATALVTPPRWSDDLAALSPVPTHLATQDRQLRRALGAADPVHLVAVTARDPEAALVASEGVMATLEAQVAKGHLQGFDAAARYLPSQARQASRQAALPPGDQLMAALERATAALPLDAETFAPFLAAVAKARTTAPLDLGDLPEAVAPRVTSLLFPRGEEWVALLPLVGLERPTAVAQALARAHPTTARLLDLKGETEALVADFRRATLERTALGAGLIVAVLGVGLGGLIPLAAVLTPVVLAVALTVAALGWLGQALSLFHLVSLLLVLGIGLDYSLFFRRGGKAEERRRTAAAVGLCGASTLLVFGLLALSAVPVLQAVGSTVILGVGFAAVAAATLAPPRPN
ncbi:MAG: MMPL family transporter, partial [Candidatus Competibacterales bacterium]